MFRERSDEFRYTLGAMDLLASFLAFGAAFGLRFFVLDADQVYLPRIDLGSYLIFGCVLAGAQVSAFAVMGLYRRQKFLSFLGEIGLLFGGTVLNLIFSFAILYYFRIYEVSRLLPVLYGVMVLVFVSGSHSLFRRVILTRRNSGRGIHHILVVGGGPTALRATEALEKNPMFGFHVIGYILEDGETNPVVPKDLIIGHLKDLDCLLEAAPPRDLVYATEHGTEVTLTQVLDACDREGIQLHVVPGFGNLVTAHGLLDNLNGLPVITIRDIPARIGFNRILKRAFDLLFAALFILVFSPVYLLVALAVKFTSKGPIFFSQERIGLDNQVFRILKFRTMRVQETRASDTLWTTKDDPRITPIGKFLRKTSLDEIPQFFNILLGQMSVVGPRPERPFYVEQFKDQYHSFKRRHAVKAGLTGWAQVNGLRGDTSIEERIAADLFYIENWTFFLDLKIVLMTPFKGMIHQNAY